MAYYISEWTTRTAIHSEQEITINEPVAGAQAEVDGMSWQLVAELKPADELTGHALVWTASQLSTAPSGVQLVADTPDTVLSAPTRNRISNALGIAMPSGTTFRQAVRRLLTSDAPGRWNELPVRSGRYEVILSPDIVDTWAA